MTAGNKPGVRLHNGPAQGFQALEVNGQTVHSAAMPLRETVRQKLGPDAANCLALLQIDETGTRFDWVAPFGGTVASWAAATPSERGAALGQLEALHSQMLATAQTMEAENEPSQQLLAGLLRKAIYFPGSDYVYLVDGKPVVTFWGFAVAQADNLDPLRYLRLLPNTPPAAPASFAPSPVAAPVVAAAPVLVAAAPSLWRWLRWVLMLFVLLLLAFFLLRACAPQVRLPWGLSTISLPGLPAAGSPAPPVVIPTPLTPPAVPAVEIPPEPPAPAPAPPPPPVAAPAPPPAAVTRPGAALRIPPDAITAKTVDFLNGRWLADAGIVDARTGQPLIVEFVFKNGTGHTTVKKSTGVSCRGSISARLQGDTLHIAVGMAQCGDNRNFNPEQVQCKPDVDGAARCTVHGDGGANYAMRISRISDS